MGGLTEAQLTGRGGTGRNFDALGCMLGTSRGIAAALLAPLARSLTSMPVSAGGGR